jgi:rod shape-determining protein MreD
VIVTPGAIARLVAITILTVVLETAGVSGVRLIGGTADLVPLVVGAVALWCGGITGACVGFAMGLLLDLLLGQDVGASSLVLTLVGYWVGRYGEQNEPSHGLLPIPVAAASTALYLAGLAIVSFLLAFDAQVSIYAFRDMFITLILNAVLALPVFWLIRRIMRPVLRVDPAERRRRRAQPIESGPIGLRGLEV